ncbi:MAG: T6SS effector BTH_I2691 family protein [Massilia sp.]
MASTNSSNPHCANCNKSGLAILPVRYAVVPHSVTATLPEPLGNKVKDVKLTHHKYALRTLRQGFVYLFYEKHARGSHIKWEAYSVSATGTLWKQLSIGAINSISDDPACSRTGHNIPASVIAIEKPEKCGRVWMAFSEHAWSVDTFTLFEKDVQARDRRMQTFHPAKWISKGNYRHGLEANEANLGQVLEYKNKTDYNSILATAQVPTLSQPDGSFVTTRLEKQTTRYPFYNRKAQTKDLVALMKKIGDNPGARDHAPAIVALWDAVGITHELAGFCHDVLGWVDKYSQERGLELGAMNAIEGLKKALPEKAVASELLRHQGHESERKRRYDLNAERRAEAERFPEPHRSRRLEVWNIVDYWTSRNLFNDEFEKRLMHADKLNEPARSSEIRKIHAQAEKYMAASDKGNQERIDGARAHGWDKYEKKLEKKAFEDFQRYHQQLLSAAETILENRTRDLIEWLESTSLISALTEFHADNLGDGTVFNEQVGDAIFGMNASRTGGAKLDEWVRQMKTDEPNLLWRAIAVNHKQSMDELDAALAEANKHQADRTLASALSWTSYTTKSLKTIADTYRKMNGIQNANSSASSANGSKAFGVALRAVNMHGIDKIVASAGDRIFKAFSVPGLADYASEKIVQHIFSLRAFVSAEDSVALVEAQARNEGLLRSEQLKRLSVARVFLAADTPAIRTEQSEALGKAWEQFKTKHTGAATAMKDARLALLVMLIEGVNFNKLLADCVMRNDAKSWWSLTASGLVITSNLFDIASVPAKYLFENAEAWSYQRLKLAGGCLGSAASAIGAVLDMREAMKAYGKGNMGFAGAYLIKGMVGLANAGLTSAATFTYAAPLIGRLTGNAALGTAARVAGTRAAAVIGFRILLMSTGAWVTVVVFGIQIFIWVISDDALEEWCSLSVFGNNRKSRDAYRTSKTQDRALGKALLEIGL